MAHSKHIPNTGIHSGCNCTTWAMACGNTEPWHTKWQPLYNHTIWQNITLREAAKTHNTVAYTVAVTVQHEQLYDMRQPRTLAYTMAATI